MGEQRSNGSLRLCLAPVGSLSLSASGKSVGKKDQSAQLDLHEYGVCSFPRLFLKPEIPKEHYLVRNL